VLAFIFFLRWPTSHHDARVLIRFAVREIHTSPGAEGLSASRVCGDMSFGNIVVTPDHRAAWPYSDCRRAVLTRRCFLAVIGLYLTVSIAERRHERGPRCHSGCPGLIFDPDLLSDDGGTAAGPTRRMSGVLSREWLPIETPSLAPRQAALGRRIAGWLNSYAPRAGEGPCL